MDWNSLCFDDDDDFSGSNCDDRLREVMEPLNKDCLLPGKDADDLQPSSSTTDISGAHIVGGGDLTPSDSDADVDDIELVRRIKERFAQLAELPEPLGSAGDEDDDFETLRAIQRRFVACYEDGTIQISEGCNNDVAGSKNLTEWHDSGAETTPVSVNISCLPKSAYAIIDAINKNRSFQKVIWEKKMQIEARLEELKKLTEQVKILVGFQLTCRKRMGRALSQKRDARVQLISLPKERFSSKGKKLSAIHCGPPKNSHVDSFRKALKYFAVSSSRKKWSKEESENLAEGVKQQFQEMLRCSSVNQRSDKDGCSRESGDLVGNTSSIQDLVIIPETMRLLLPKVIWDQVASMYLPGRSGAECQSRWLNWENPLIKHEGWDKSEEKNLVQVVQQKVMSNWVDISASLGVCRTPFQCLSHYQRSLNASILKREWTKEEDTRLRAAVGTFGQSNWQVVASSIEGRSGTQCSNRWIKSLHPAKGRSVRWSADEDTRLKVAVILCHPKAWRDIGQSLSGRTPIWKKVAQYVPGRTHVQYRERWVNSLDPL